MTARTICVGLCLWALCSTAPAQEAAQTTRSFDFSSTDLQAAVSEISKIYDVKVFSQEGVKGSVTAKGSNAGIEAALTMVTAPNGLAWRKFVLAVKPTDEVTARTLGDLMAALDVITYAGMMMQGPQSDSSLLIERTSPPQELTGTTAPDGSTYTSFYYVYDPKAKRPEPAKLAKEKRPGRVFGMPDDLNKQIDQHQQWFSGLDPEAKKRVLGALMKEMMSAEGAIFLELGDDVIPNVGEGPVRVRSMAIRVDTKEDTDE